MSEYSQAKSDYQALYKTYEREPNDFCGASCNVEVLFLLLEQPTNKRASKIYRGFITDYFKRGVDPVDGKNTHDPLSRKIHLMSKETREIFVRNGDISV